MKDRFSKFCLSAALMAGLLLPGQAFATDKDDWKLTSSMPASSYDSDGKLMVNVGRCRSLFDISTGDVSFLFTLASDAEIADDALYSIKFAKGNESCSKTMLDEDPNESCLNIANNQKLTATSSPIEIRRPVAELSSATSADECENMNATSYIHLIVSEVDTLNVENTYTVSYAIDFRTERPDAPTGVTASAGGTSIKLNWTAVPDVASYKIYYGTEGALITSGAYPEEVEGANTATASSTSTTLKDKISADKTYIIGVTAVNSNGNESLIGEVVTAETKASKDFWDSYREENADVDGGFCFIATAAYGSTQEPHVAVLRQFRDDVLLQSEAGTKFVETYYELSPPIAHFIGQHDTARAITRVLLWPAYGFAYLQLKAPIVLWSILTLFAAAIGFAIFRKCRRRFQIHKAAAPLLAAAIATGGFLAAPETAHAESPVNMMVEFKAGPYTPDNLGGAFASHFGENSGYIIEGEYDWQFYRGIGSLGLGFHLGYGSVTGKSLEESGEQSVDATELHWLPLRLSLVYRFDWLWTEFEFPFTIYVKAGFDYSVWWVVDGSDSIAVSDDGSEGYGGTFGFHVVAGVAFVLDWLADEMEKSFDVEWGINNSYIFAEYMYVQLDNFGAGGALDLTEKATFHIGIGLEF